MLFSRRDFLLSSLLTAGASLSGCHNGRHSTAERLFPSHPPLGEGQGINPGRVVWIYEPEAVDWNGEGYWWQPRNFKERRISAMINEGLMLLTGEKSSAKAWSALFTWRNVQNGKDGGYKAGQKIAIKANMNGSGEHGSDPLGHTHASYANAVLLKCLLTSLVEEAGVSPGAITVYDACRIFPQYMLELCSRGILAGVNFRQRDAGGALEAIADPEQRIVWAGKVEGEASYLPKCLTEADYLINLGTLKGHWWGMSLTGKNHFGSLVNSDKVRPPKAAGLHENFIDNQAGDYSVIVDLMAHRQIGGKSILYMLDALLTPRDEVRRVTRSNTLWQQPPFNGNFVSSLFFSQDPVAIDSVGADFLVNEPTILKYNSNFEYKNGMENYLHEAALIENPPSGTAYTDGMGRKPRSLGAHEHWNNVEDKQYSRNLGKSEGIELLRNK